MKKWIAIVTAMTCCFSSALPADDATPVESTVGSDPATVEDSDTGVETTSERKSVGKAAEDGSTTASTSHMGKYLLAGGAIAVGVIALVLISRNSGHHRH